MNHITLYSCQSTLLNDNLESKYLKDVVGEETLGGIVHFQNFG